MLVGGGLQLNVGRLKLPGPVLNLGLELDRGQAPLLLEAGVLQPYGGLGGKGGEEGFVLFAELVGPPIFSMR